MLSRQPGADCRIKVLFNYPTQTGIQRERENILVVLKLKFQSFKQRQVKERRENNERTWNEDASKLKEEGRARTVET